MQPAHSMIIKRNFILRGSYFYEKYKIWTGKVQVNQYHFEVGPKWHFC